MKKLIQTLLFAMFFMTVGGAIVYRSDRAKVVVAPAPHEAEIQPKKTDSVIDAERLIAQTRTYRVTYEETYVVEYIEADSCWGYEQLMWLFSADGNLVRAIPQERIRNVVVYEAGEKWTVR